MKIVIAPDSFKGSLSAMQVAEAIRDGILKVNSQIKTVLVPMADGGEGTVQSLMDSTGGEFVELMVHDPLSRKINSFYGIMGNGKTAVIEMAAASGLPLLKDEEKNPLKTTSFGTGELIKDALDRGCNEIIIGLGGSATNDGGIGMARALGVRFINIEGIEVSGGGGELLKIDTVDISNIDPRIKNVKFVAACDVDNPLCGKNGASNIYGRQKGASDNDRKVLDRGLAHFSNIIKQQFDVDLKDLPGAGAAGGIGYAVMFFLNGKLEKGIDIISRETGLADKMSDADLVITGEGKIDFQTQFGKTPFGVAQIAKSKNVPVIAIAGSLGENYETLFEKGFDGIFSIIDSPMSLDEALNNSRKLLKNAAESITRLLLSTKHIIKVKN